MIFDGREEPGFGDGLREMSGASGLLAELDILVTGIGGEGDDGHWIPAALVFDGANGPGSG